jgi:Mrp family chromosome partitioning ATPase
MSRILDALKKSRPAPDPLPAPAAPPLPSAFRPPVAVAPARVVGPAPAVVAWTLPTELDEDVHREMSALRVGIEAALSDRFPRIVGFVGSTWGEGTSTVARDFALSLLRGTEGQVLLVDANAHRPAFRDSTGTRLRESRASALSVLPLGEQFASDGRILPSTLREAIDALTPGYEWIVVDLAPAIEAPDAPALAASVHGVVLVVRAGRTKRPVLSRAADVLLKGGARVLGTVLNRRRLEIPEFIYRRL